MYGLRREHGSPPERSYQLEASPEQPLYSGGNPEKLSEASTAFTLSASRVDTQRFLFHPLLCTVVLLWHNIVNIHRLRPFFPEYCRHVPKKENTFKVLFHTLGFVGEVTSLRFSYSILRSGSTGLGIVSVIQHVQHLELQRNCTAEETALQKYYG